jgi:hypothetical protein
MACAAKRPLCQRKTGVDWKKDLQISGAGRKSRKRPRLVVGKKPNIVQPERCKILFLLKINFITL